MRRFSVPVTALLLSLCACSDEPSSVGTGPDPVGGVGFVGPTPTPLTATSISGSASIIQAIESSLEGRPFRGTRRVVERHDAGTGPIETLETVEDVGWDGVGEYAIELIDAVQLPTNMDPMRFDMIFERSVDTRWKSRDFRVRSATLVATNYTVRETGTTTVVAGIQCETVEFVRNVSIDDRPSHYEVDVDPSTGMVLAWREFDFHGQVLVQSTYESFAYDGDLTDMILRRGALDATPLDIRVDLANQAGFNVNVPDVLPPGFALSAARTVEIAGGKVLDAKNDALLTDGDWVRFVATDGIESLSFAHADPAKTHPYRSETRLNVLTQGTWEIGLGRVRGVSFVVMGRLADNHLRQIVESAF